MKHEARGDHLKGIVEFCQEYIHDFRRHMTSILRWSFSSLELQLTGWRNVKKYKKVSMQI